MWRRRLGWSVLAAGVMALAAYWIAGHPCLALTGPVICRVDTRLPLVALTFDDGPTMRGVDAVLPVLAAHDARATFFLVGHEVAGRGDLARRIMAGGHEIGNHGWHHRRMLDLTPGAAQAELARTNRLLRAAGAEGTIAFRPPYGKKLTGLPIAARRLGMPMVTWDVADPAGEDDPQAYADDVVARTRPGAIILMHPMYAGGETARRALPLILVALRRRGFRVVTVGELMAGEAR